MKNNVTQEKQERKNLITICDIIPNAVKLKYKLMDDRKIK